MAKKVNSKTASNYKKLTPDQLEKLGFSRKSERYYLDTGKKLTKRSIASRVISKRQHQNIQRGATYGQFKAEVEAGQRSLSPNTPQAAVARKRALGRKTKIIAGQKTYIYPMRGTDDIDATIKRIQKNHKSGRIIIQIEFSNKSDKGKPLFRQGRWLNLNDEVKTLENIIIEDFIDLDDKYTLQNGNVKNIFIVVRPA